LARDGSEPVAFPCLNTNYFERVPRPREPVLPVAERTGCEEIEQGLGKAIAGKWRTRLRRVNCEAVNGLGRKPKTGAQAKQGQRRAGIVRHQGATTGA
jgi:hypothetical protein